MHHIDPDGGLVLGVDCTEVIEAYEAIRRPAWEAYQAIERPALEAYQANLLDLDDPLVTWIARNALPSYLDQATDILRLLPCPLAALDAYAATQDWCGTWTDLRDQAVADLDLTPVVTAP